MYNVGKETGAEYTHLPYVVLEMIKLVFGDLHGKTQNHNDSVNSRPTIWFNLPKIIFVSLKPMEFGVYDAIAKYNKVLRP